MGWHCSDTAQLRFDGVRVPARYRLGEEGAGFRMIMGNFNGERIGIAAGASLTIAVRDRGVFMDPRSRKDWW